MNPDEWLDKAMEELNSLAATMQDDPADAWRALTLAARLLSSPNPKHHPSETITQQFPRLLEVAGPPDPEEVLDVIADELNSVTDAWGPLLDGLIDADDALGVLRISDQEDVARRLSERVAGLVSLYPERTLSLGSFADMRLKTVRDDSVVASIWRTIERAPAQMLADALPVQAQELAAEIATAPSELPWLNAAYSRLQRSFAAFVDAASDMEAPAEPMGVSLDFSATLGRPSIAPLELAWRKIRSEIAPKSMDNVQVPSTRHLRSVTSSSPTSTWALDPPLPNHMAELCFKRTLEVAIVMLPEDAKTSELR